MVVPARRWLVRHDQTSFAGVRNTFPLQSGSPDAVHRHRGACDKADAPVLLLRRLRQALDRASEITVGESMTDNNSPSWNHGQSFSPHPRSYVPEPTWKRSKGSSRRMVTIGTSVVTRL